MLSGQDRSHETHLRMCQSPAIYWNNSWTHWDSSRTSQSPLGYFVTYCNIFVGVVSRLWQVRITDPRQPFGGQPDHRSLVIGDEKLCQNLESLDATHVIYVIGAATLSISKSNSNFLIIYRATYHDVYFLNRRSNLFFCSSMNFTSTRDHLCSFKLCL